LIRVKLAFALIGALLSMIFDATTIAFWEWKHLRRRLWSQSSSTTRRPG
jgi:hypothetical protein